MENKDYEQKKRECWEEYVNLLNHNSAARYVFDKIFDRAYALGKQEKDAEDTVIQGWVARDKDENLFIYTNPPKRIYDGVYSQWSGDGIESLSKNLFPDLTWDDDPQEVEIVIKRKKK